MSCFLLDRPWLALSAPASSQLSLSFSLASPLGLFGHHHRQVKPDQLAGWQT
jgi:hypothetical protein